MDSQYPAGKEKKKLIFDNSGLFLVKLVDNVFFSLVCWDLQDCGSLNKPQLSSKLKLSMRELAVIFRTKPTRRFSDIFKNVNCPRG